jgi:hypothetical protein
MCERKGRGKGYIRSKLLEQERRTNLLSIHKSFYWTQRCTLALEYDSASCALGLRGGGKWGRGKNGGELVDE